MCSAERTEGAARGHPLARPSSRVRRPIAPGECRYAAGRRAPPERRSCKEQTTRGTVTREHRTLAHSERTRFWFGIRIRLANAAWRAGRTSDGRRMPRERRARVGMPVEVGSLRPPACNPSILPSPVAALRGWRPRPLCHRPSPPPGVPSARTEDAPATSSDAFHRRGAFLPSYPRDALTGETRARRDASTRGRLVDACAGGAPGLPHDFYDR